MMPLTDPHIVPFTIAGGVMAGLVLIEGLSLVIGHSMSGLVEHWMEIEGGHAGLDGHDVGSPAAWLSWINVGRVPFLILLIIALATFTLAGVLIQGVAEAVYAPLPAPVAVLGALGLSVPAMRSSSRLVAAIIPRDESYVVDDLHFVGRYGEVTLGPLDQGAPGQVRVLDAHNNSHALRARAAPGQDDIAQGTRVLLVDHAGGVFTAVPDTDSPIHPN